MDSIVFLLVLCVMVQGQELRDPYCGQREGAGLRSYGGEDTTEGEWPWIVALTNRLIDEEYFCGGSLVSQKHVLSGEKIDK